MSRLNFARLARATTPAVVNAGKQFVKDSARAFRSGGVFAREAQSSWRHHSPLTKGAGTDE